MFVAAYLVGVLRPHVDSEVIEVLVGVRIGFPFGYSLEFGVILASESQLRSRDLLSEVGDDVEDEGVDELVDEEARCLVKEMIL